MTAKLLLNYVLSADICLFLAALVLMARSGAYRQMKMFTGFLSVCALQTIADVVVMFHRQQFGISKVSACQIFKYASWSGEVVVPFLLLFSIYGIFRNLMSPLHGLQRMGGLMFRWVGAVALCLASLVVFGAHPAGTSEWATLMGQFQEGVAILTLCLLLAVSIATRPLGLSVWSRSFGTLLGLGVLCASGLIGSTWFTTSQTASPYSAVYLIGGFASMVASTTWIVYFARPEPARRMITLPTTSPFFFWNRIAEALGDAPGEVVVGGLSPAMFAPAELLAFSTLAPRQPAPVVEMPTVAQR